MKLYKKAGSLLDKIVYSEDRDTVRITKNVIAWRDRVGFIHFYNEQNDNRDIYENTIEAYANIVNLLTHGDGFGG